MSINSCLVLSAGKGTRMGEIGKVFPKPLWPVFEKRLLEIQLDYLRPLNLKNVFINTHHCASMIEEYLDKKNISIEVLYEKELLGSGGGIHNCVNKIKNKKGYLLVINSDQIYFSDVDKIKDIALKYPNEKAILFSMKVSAQSNYNEVVTVENNLVKIAKSDGKNEEYETFSGISLINIGNLDIVDGDSSFFDTVANYKEEKIKMFPLNEDRVIDFGTSSKYVEGIEELKKLSHDFIIKNRIVIEDKLDLKNDSYSSSKKGEFVFSKEFSLDFCKRKINYKNIEMSF